MLYCWTLGRVVPNVSRFPEINFASKCTDVRTERDGTGAGVDVLLEGLGNANSKQIVERLREKKVFVGAIRRDDISEGAIVLVTNDKVEELEVGNKYL